MAHGWLRGVSTRSRQVLTVLALGAVAVAAVTVGSTHSQSAVGFSTVQTAGAEPTGPGPTGPDGSGPDGTAFIPPSAPSAPGYEGGNQPPMNQDNGISIYQTGAQGAPQQSAQPGVQQPQRGWEQPAHGTQPPDYSTAPGYTQGPGRENPDYQGPQQGSQQAPTQTVQQSPSLTTAPSQQPSPTQPSQPSESPRPSETKQQDCTQSTTNTSAVRAGRIAYDYQGTAPEAVSSAIGQWNKLGRFLFEKASAAPDLVIKEISEPNRPGSPSSYQAPKDGKPATITVNIAKLAPGDMGKVLLHELGHAVGLPDTADRGTLMSGQSDNITPADAANYAALGSDGAVCGQNAPDTQDFPGGSANFEEWRYCSAPSRWMICASVIGLGDDAEDLALTMFPPESQDGGVGDAFRHCAWAGTIAVKHGADKAREFTDRHEAGNDRNDPGVAMDFANNATGIAFAETAEKTGDVMVACENAAKAGQLVTVS